MTELEKDRSGEAQATSTGVHADPRARSGDDDGSLLGGDERTDLRERWDALQGRFLDDPEGAARLADDLVGEARQLVGRRLEERQEDLRHRWRDRDERSTEDLRSAVRRYRDLFERLLTI